MRVSPPCAVLLLAFSAADAGELMTRQHLSGERSPGGCCQSALAPGAPAAGGGDRFVIRFPDQDFSGTGAVGSSKTAAQQPSAQVPAQTTDTPSKCSGVIVFGGCTPTPPSDERSRPPAKPKKPLHRVSEPVVREIAASPPPAPPKPSPPRPRPEPRIAPAVIPPPPPVEQPKPKPPPRTIIATAPIVAAPVVTKPAPPPVVAPKPIVIPEPRRARSTPKRLAIAVARDTHTPVVPMFAQPGSLLNRP